MNDCGLNQLSTHLVEKSAHLCPHCHDGYLQYTSTKSTGNTGQHELWLCDSDACHYAAEDFNGMPIERHSCPACGRYLKLIRSDAPFWACSGWYDETHTCRFNIGDIDGKPAL